MIPQRYSAFHNLIVPQSFAKDFIFGKEHLFHRFMFIRKHEGQRLYYWLDNLWYIIVEILEGNKFIIYLPFYILISNIGKLNLWMTHFKQERTATLAYVERLIQLLLLLHINCIGYGADLAKFLDRLSKNYPFKKSLTAVWLSFIGQLQTKLYTASSDFITMMNKAGEPFVLLRR